MMHLVQLWTNETRRRHILLTSKCHASLWFNKCDQNQFSFWSGGMMILLLPSSSSFGLVVRTIPLLVAPDPHTLNSEKYLFSSHSSYANAFLFSKNYLTDETPHFVRKHSRSGQMDVPLTKSRAFWKYGTPKDLQLKLMRQGVHSERSKGGM